MLIGGNNGRVVFINFKIPAIKIDSVYHRDIYSIAGFTQNDQITDLTTYNLSRMKIHTSAKTTTRRGYTGDILTSVAVFPSLYNEFLFGGEKGIIYHCSSDGQLIETVKLHPNFDVNNLLCMNRRPIYFALINDTLLIQATTEPSPHTLKETRYYSPVSALALSGNDRLLAVGTFDGAILLYSLNPFKHVFNLKSHHGHVVNIALDWSGDVMLTANQDSSASLYLIQERRQIVNLRKPQVFNQKLIGCYFPTDQNFLVLAGENGRIWFFDRSNLNLLGSLELFSAGGWIFKDNENSLYEKSDNLGIDLPGFKKVPGLFKQTLNSN